MKQHETKFHVLAVWDGCPPKHPTLPRGNIKKPCPKNGNLDANQIPSRIELYLIVSPIKPLHPLGVPHFSIFFFCWFQPYRYRKVSKPVVFFIQPLYRSLKLIGSLDLQPHHRLRRKSCRNSCVRLTSEMENQYCNIPSLAILKFRWLLSAAQNRGQTYRPCGQCMLLQHQLHNWLRLMRRKWKIWLGLLFRQSQLIEY